MRVPSGEICASATKRKSYRSSAVIAGEMSDLVAAIADTGFIVPYLDRLDRRTRTGLLVGALAMFLALDVAFLVSLIGLPFAPFALGQAIIDVLPGFVSIPLIETLQYWAKGLLVVGALVLFFISGATAGALAVSARRRDLSVAAAVAAPWVVAVALGQLFAPLRIDFATSLIDAAVGIAANSLGLAFLAPASLSQDRSPAPERRRVLLTRAGIAALVAIGALPPSAVLAA